jgi:hypothetical protein
MSGLSYHFPLICVYYWATYLWLSTVIVFTNFSSLILLLISLIRQGLTRVWRLRNNCVVIESIYSYSSRQPSPLHSGYWKKPSIAITFAVIARLVHISAQQWISTICCFNHFSWMKHVQLELLRLCYGVVVYSIYSYSFGQPFPLHFLIWKKHSISITSAGVSRSVHFSAPQCNLTMNHLFWMTISTKFELSSLHHVKHFCLIFTGWSDEVSIVFMVNSLTAIGAIPKLFLCLWYT